MNELDKTLIKEKSFKKFFDFNYF